MVLNRLLICFTIKDDYLKTLRTYLLGDNRSADKILKVFFTVFLHLLLKSASIIILNSLYLVKN
jgi:hypothetical protein